MEKLDFDVDFSKEQKADDSVKGMTHDMAQRWLDSAVASVDSVQGIMSTELPDGMSPGALTLDSIYQLATDAQNNLSNIIALNKIIRRAVNSNDLIGLSVDVVSALINTDIKLTFAELPGGKKIANRMDKAKKIISAFNDQVDIKAFIRSQIIDTYTSGTVISVLREKDLNWSITRFPLGVAELSGYYENGRPVVIINMDQLKSTISHTILRNRKGKALFFDDVLNEIGEVFGPEILAAYKNRERYARLPVSHTGVSRGGDLNGLYGVSAITKALPSTILLDAQRNADFANAAASRKIILHQKMRKEAYSVNDEHSFELQAYNHGNLSKAFKAKNVLITTNPSVESLEYVMPKQLDSEAVAKRESLYEGQILGALGISFLIPSTAQSATTTKIGFTVLCRNLDRIAESVADVIHGFYKTVLLANGFLEDYVPKVDIMSTELMSMEERRELAKLLYTTMSASRDTVYHVLGLDLNDETAKRRIENGAGLDEVFTPYPISYTQAGDDEGGRPLGDDDGGRQDYDQTINE